MFGRNKPATEATPVDPDPTPTARSKDRAKAGPTPTRREAEAARRKPLVPADRKAAQSDAKDKMRAERARHREAMMAGEEWALAPRDRGPQRRYIRDYVDARWSIGEFLLPIMLVGLVVTMIPQAQSIGYITVYGTFVAALIDILVVWWRLRGTLTRKFGHKPDRGTLWYMFSRMMQMRIARIPRPAVARGQYPS